MQDMAAEKTWTRLGAYMVACAAMGSPCIILQERRFEQFT